MDESGAGDADGRDSPPQPGGAVDLTGIRVRRAVSGADFVLVANLRRASAPRMFARPTGEWLDSLDYSLHSFCLIAYDESDEPVATMRIQDGPVSELQLARLIPLDAVLTPGQMPVVEFGRFGVVSASRGADAMAALFKAAWVWCLECEVRNILVAAPEWLKPLCEALTFENPGKPEALPDIYCGGIWYSAMILPPSRLIDTWGKAHHPLADQFLRTAHPALMFDRPGVLMPLQRG